MRMFHELMMRKKEQIMYATIKGTLTENDGVFSGFSVSNCLQTQNNFPLQSTNFEIVTRIKNDATDSNERYFVAGNDRSSFIIGTTRVSANTFTFKLYGGNSTGTGAGWNKQSEQITIDETQFFDVKFAYNGSEYALYINGSKIISYTSSTALYGNKPVRFGQWNSANSNSLVFVGSIDLNQSYIKLGSTKYNLQAVVGYTIVGSPTIVDGVVSGFSSSDYLQTSSLFEETTDNFEAVVKFNAFSYAGTNTYKGLVGTGGIGWFLGLHQQYNRFVVYVSSTGTNWNIAIDKRGTYNIPINTDIYVKVLKNSTSFKVLYSLNGSSWIEDINIDMTSAVKSGTNRNIRFGGAVAGTTTYIDGSIDIANSYIKINNKLWFNGQQA